MGTSIPGMRGSVLPTGIIHREPSAAAGGGGVAGDLGKGPGSLDLETGSPSVSDRSKRRQGF